MGRILTNLSFFSGVGGMDLGAKMAGGIKTICYCENDRYAQGVLRSRIADGGLEDAPIWDDVTSFDGKPWQGTDIISGGFPCQDVSVAGKREGIEKGNRSGLFYELMRVCREVRPRFILLENVAGLLIYPGAHRVFGELAEMGFDAGWKIVSASDVGANHQRKRIWIVAYSDRARWGSWRTKFKGQFGSTAAISTSRKMADPAGKRCGKEGSGGAGASQWPPRSGKYVADTKCFASEVRRNDNTDAGQGGGWGNKPGGSGKNDRRKSDPEKNEGVADAGGESGPQESSPLSTERSGGNAWDHAKWGSWRSPTRRDWWLSEPSVGRVVDGLAFRVDRLKCCGNGVVPLQSIPAWEEIKRLADMAQ